MVIRILRARVKPDRVPEFWERALTKVAAARRVPGIIDVHLGNQAEGSGHQFVFIRRWQSIEALYAWAGGLDLLARPIFFQGLEDALLEVDIQHHVDVEPSN